jgi:predicted subunit of tRNA(5-methylaminomethyl-2-thiouridylate) methyltransferase
MPDDMMLAVLPILNPYGIKTELIIIHFGINGGTITPDDP